MQLFFTGNKALIKLLSTLYDVGMDHMCDNVGGLMSLLSDTPASSTTGTSDTKSSSGSKDAVNAENKLDTEEQEIIMGLLSKMCAKRPKVCDINCRDLPYIHNDQKILAGFLLLAMFRY